mmetsp:Transcript_20915/g.53169  ORF Transcript_20915/g.53169 Transcript_20915/m.53169 type:complete len:675 (-) Transcript_20915:2016-4040(-)
MLGLLGVEHVVEAPEEPPADPHVEEVLQEVRGVLPVGAVPHPHPGAQLPGGAVHLEPALVRIQRNRHLHRPKIKQPELKTHDTNLPRQDVQAPGGPVVFHQREQGEQLDADDEHRTHVRHHRHPLPNPPRHRHRHLVGLRLLLQLLQRPLVLLQHRPEERRRHHRGQRPQRQRQQQPDPGRGHDVEREPLRVHGVAHRRGSERSPVVAHVARADLAPRAAPVVPDAVPVVALLPIVHDAVPAGGLRGVDRGPVAPVAPGRAVPHAVPSPEAGPNPKRHGVARGEVGDVVQEPQARRRADQSDPLHVHLRGSGLHEGNGVVLKHSPAHLADQLRLVRQDVHATGPLRVEILPHLVGLDLHQARDLHPLAQGHGGELVEGPGQTHPPGPGPNLLQPCWPAAEAHGGADEDGVGGLAEKRPAARHQEGAHRYAEDRGLGEAHQRRRIGELEQGLMRGVPGRVVPTNDGLIVRRHHAPKPGNGLALRLVADHAALQDEKIGALRSGRRILGLHPDSKTLDVAGRHVAQLRVAHDVDPEPTDRAPILRPAPEARRLVPHNGDARVRPGIRHVRQQRRAQLGRVTAGELRNGVATRHQVPHRSPGRDLQDGVVRDVRLEAGHPLEPGAGGVGAALFTRRGGEQRRHPLHPHDVVPDPPLGLRALHLHRALRVPPPGVVVN